MILADRTLPAQEDVLAPQSTKLPIRKPLLDPNLNADLNASIIIVYNHTTDITRQVLTGESVKYYLWNTKSNVPVGRDLGLEWN